ncbi:MAG: hypothetical protein GC154_11665 [bacterium]|nr:hypothetical protein [bacterium]
MKTSRLSRRQALRAISLTGAALPAIAAIPQANAAEEAQGSQRLSLTQLRGWEALQYGMFIHFGMSTYAGEELPDGSQPASMYAPNRLDVDQWVSVARDAGMKYAVLTTKHVAGHCLWPSRHTDYTVANSGNKTDVVEQFVNACAKRGVKPGFYYCSWDNHHKFGSQTPSDVHWTEVMNRFPQGDEKLAPFTSSLYQTFQSAQIHELLTQYGEIAEVWIDIPGVLGPGYRRYLYQAIAELQPNAVIMMNTGIGTGEDLKYDYAWPSDLIAIERRLPPESGHRKWREVDGKSYYIPGELCDPIGKEWFFVEGDAPRPDDDLLRQFQACRRRGVNCLLDVPPGKNGVIPAMHVDALMRLRKNAGL